MKPSPSISYSWNAPVRVAMLATSHNTTINQSKRHTFKLLVQSSPTCYAQRADEFFELNSPVLVLVKYVEDIIRKLARIAKWEKLLVYAAEFGLVELSRWAVFQEALIPAKCVSGISDH